MEVKHDGRHFGLDHRLDQHPGPFQRLTTRLDELLGFGHRAELERRFDDHAQTAVTADKQFGEVVACDVFDDLAA